MEKFKSILFGLLVVLSFSACHDDDNEYYNMGETGEISFTGTTNVTTISSGDIFTQSDKMFTITYHFNKDTINKGTLDILMEEAKFAVGMPMGFDMQLKQIPYTQSGENITFTTSSVIPEIADTPYEHYVITNLKGSIVGDKLTVDFACMGNYTVNFVGSVFIGNASK